MNAFFASGIGDVARRGRRRQSRAPAMHRTTNSHEARRFARRWALLALAALVIAACGGPRPARVPLPPPVESTTVGVGDLFVLTIVGEDKLPKEYRVAPDGSVDLPYIHRMQVAGLEPQQIAEQVRARLRDGGVLMDASVSVDVKEYNSKRVSVLGQVQKPGSFSLTPGITLVQAISQAGGFNSIANRDRINLTRTTQGRARTIVLSLDSITDGSQPDVPLQAGDTIFVTERVF